MASREETLAKVRQKYPQYADMSDDALGTALAAKYPQYADLAPQQAQAEAPAPKPQEGAVSGWWRRNVYEPANRAFNVATEPLVAGARLVNGEAPSQVADSYLREANPNDAIAQQQARARNNVKNPLAGMVETPADAAVTTALSAVPGGLLARGATAIGAGALAGAASDEGAASGAFKGATGAAIGGALSGLAGASKTIRGKELLQPGDVARVTGVAEDMAPGTFKAAKPATKAGAEAAVEDFKTFLTDDAEKAASKAYRDGVRAAIDSVGYKNPMVQSQTYNEMHGLPPNQAVSAEKLWNFITDKALQNRFMTPKGTERTGIAAQDMKRAVAQMRNDLGNGLEARNPLSGAMYRQTNGEYAASQALQELYGVPGVIDKTTNAIDMARLQQLLHSPKNKGEVNLMDSIARRVGPDGMDKLRAAIFRGADQTVPDTAGQMPRITPWTGITVGGALAGTALGHPAALAGLGVEAARLGHQTKMPAFTGSPEALKVLQPSAWLGRTGALAPMAIEGMKGPTSVE
jgi:hypothetical protein